MKKIIAMIPARMGSKRIPKKNIKYLNGKPLIQYPIDLALKVNLFEEVWVNSESEMLGRFAEAKSVDFHKRPVELSTDKSTNQDFTREFLQNHECDYVVMVNSTSPLLREETLKSFCEYIQENDFDTVLSVVSEKAESFLEGKPINFSLDEKVNSQQLKPVEKIVWALTAWKREAFLKVSDEGKCAIYAGNIGLFSVPKDESCDLDTPEDWAIAEGMLASRSINLEEEYWGC